MLLAADSGQVTSLCLLDLSAVFDTVDHDLLLLHLERQFGIRGVVLQWFRSYLHGRTYRVIYGGATSAVIIIGDCTSQKLFLSALCVIAMCHCRVLIEETVAAF